jgi:murein DD-endopeptidase MepM/ murein hydrolase activator NlpD
MISVSPLWQHSIYLQNLFKISGVRNLMSRGMAAVVMGSCLVPAFAAQAQESPDPLPLMDSLCPPPVLERYLRHSVQTGETLEAIATQYDLLPATILALNPGVQDPLAPGQVLVIPPFNGIQITPPTDSTWRSLAAKYQVRADLLFEMNGCQPLPGAVVFIPGVQGFLTPGEEPPSAITGYPLASPARILLGYGWQVDPTTGVVAFHSGVDLEAELGSPVFAVGDGVIAFAGEQGSYGNLVVINHSQGLQTRYAQLEDVLVSVGQSVIAGTPIGTVGMTGDAIVPHLHFEVRLNSNLGWVAEDPGRYIPETRLGRPIVDEPG